MTTTVTVNIAGRTHVGRVRRRNEDSLYLGQSLVAVADGLGGHVAGDIASTIAIDTLRAYDRSVDPTDLADTLGQAINAVNEALRRKTTAAPALAGMATTLVALMWAGNTAILANLGDSRAYLRRGAGAGHTIQITEDHTYNRLVADAADVPNLPERLSRFLDGRIDGRSPDLTPWGLQSGDRFLLCSDGLSSYVPRGLIHTAMSSPDGPDDVADRLVSLALDHGGPDNVTVIVVDVKPRRGEGPVF
jgi:PPM family protein phosphatase